MEFETSVTIRLKADSDDDEEFEILSIGDQMKVERKIIEHMEAMIDDVVEIDNEIVDIEGFTFTIESD